MGVRKTFSTLEALGEKIKQLAEKGDFNVIKIYLAGSIMHEKHGLKSDQVLIICYKEWAKR